MRSTEKFGDIKLGGEVNTVEKRARIPAQTGAVGYQEPYEVQQRQMQDLAPGKA